MISVRFIDFMVSVQLYSRVVSVSLPHREPSQVVPSEQGQQQKPWFFLQRSYWQRRAADAEHEKLLAHLLSASTAEKGIAVAISNLRKTYGGADGDKQVRLSFASALPLIAPCGLPRSAESHQECCSDK